jgi:hypothetical protein
MIGIRWILRSLCSLRMTQSGGFVIVNEVKNPFLSHTGTVEMKEPWTGFFALPSASLRMTRERVGEVTPVFHYERVTEWP